MDAIQIVQEYLNKKKIIEELLLDYLENDDKENATFNKLINYYLFFIVYSENKKKKKYQSIYIYLLQILILENHQYCCKREVKNNSIADHDIFFKQNALLYITI